MEKQLTFTPGDRVCFTFWSSYKAKQVSRSTTHAWYELFPGDEGIIIAVDDQMLMLIVLFTRVKKLLHVHSSQVTVYTDTSSNE